MDNLSSRPQKNVRLVWKFGLTDIQVGFINLVVGIVLLAIGIFFFHV
ncbi:hypothetical protein [Caballeronia sp. BR00000012568055]|nr:hypothetical protein [Caballeronia sp. BR00000012568055]